MEMSWQKKSRFESATVLQCRTVIKPKVADGKRLSVCVELLLETRFTSARLQDCDAVCAAAHLSAFTTSHL